MSPGVRCRGASLHSISAFKISLSDPRGPIPGFLVLSTTVRSAVSGWLSTGSTLALVHSSPRFTKRSGILVQDILAVHCILAGYTCVCLDTPVAPPPGPPARWHSYPTALAAPRALAAALPYFFGFSCVSILCQFLHRRCHLLSGTGSAHLCHYPSYPIPPSSLRPTCMLSPLASHCIRALAL